MLGKMAVVDTYANDREFGSLLDFGSFGSEFGDSGVFEPICDWGNTDVCNGLQFYDVSESSLCKELEDFEETVNNVAPLADLGDFESKEFGDFQEDLGNFESGEFGDFPPFQEEEIVPEFDDPKRIPQSVPDMIASYDAQTIADVVAQVVKSLQFGKQVQKQQNENPQQEHDPIQEKKKRHYAPKQIAPKCDVNKKRVKTTRGGPRKSVSLPVQSSSCTRFWSSVPNDDSITTYPTIIPAQAFEKITKTGDFRESDVSMRYKIARAFGQHYPNQWLLRSILKSVFPDFHKARGTLINKASAAKSMVAWPALTPGSTFGLYDNMLLLAQFGNDWYFMVWRQTRERLSNCPMVAVGQKCPSSLNCPAS